jgi:MFS family permease
MSLSAPASPNVPSWWPARVYYGWAMVLTLGLTATVSYGILSYAFAVFITPMGAELGWSKAKITGAFSLAQLVAGVTAVPLGRWVDRHGARGVMTVGSALGALLLVAWSRVHSVVAFYLVWTLLGVVSAAVLYEPAFAVVATWFRRDRGRALTVLTFIGGFASVVFVPLTTFLVERSGWRTALLWLAGIYAVLTVVPHALVLRRRPGDVGLEADGSGGTHRADMPPPAVSHGAAGPGERSVAAHHAIRSGSFRWLAVAFALSAVITTAISVHLVPLLLERGHSSTFAGAAMGVLGLMALPGRLIFTTPLGGWWSRTAVTATIFGVSGLAIALLLASRDVAVVWLFVALFGAGFGAITPARAALVAETFGAANYGAISGVLALVLSVARAAAPVGASVVYGAHLSPWWQGYNTVLVLLVMLALGAAGSILMVSGGRRSLATVDVTATSPRA